MDTMKSRSSTWEAPMVVEISALPQALGVCDAGTTATGTIATGTGCTTGAVARPENCISGGTAA